MHRLVLTTTGNREEAEKIARGLVDAKLAACVNIVPHITSIYRWQGDVESAEECLLLIKTVAQQTDAVRKKIVELHSYDLPECIGFDISCGSESYLAWITESTR